MEVVVNIRFQARIGFQDVFERVGVLCRCLCRTIALTCDDEGHNIFSFNILALCYLTEGDLDGGHRTTVGVFFRRFAELGEDCVGLDWDLIVTHTSGEGSEIFVYILDNGVGLVTRKEEAEEFA